MFSSDKAKSLEQNNNDLLACENDSYTEDLILDFDILKHQQPELLFDIQEVDEKVQQLIKIYSSKESKLLRLTQIEYELKKILTNSYESLEELLNICNKEECDVANKLLKPILYPEPDFENTYHTEFLSNPITTFLFNFDISNLLHSLMKSHVKHIEAKFDLIVKRISLPIKKNKLLIEIFHSTNVNFETLINMDILPKEVYNCLIPIINKCFILIDLFKNYKNLLDDGKIPFNLKADYFINALRELAEIKIKSMWCYSSNIQFINSSIMSNKLSFLNKNINSETILIIKGKDYESILKSYSKGSNKSILETKYCPQGIKKFSLNDLNYFKAVRKKETRAKKLKNLIEVDSLPEYIQDNEKYHEEKKSILDKKSSKKTLVENLKITIGNHLDNLNTNITTLKKEKRKLQIEIHQDKARDHSNMVKIKQLEDIIQENQQKHLDDLDLLRDQYDKQLEDCKKDEKVTESSIMATLKSFNFITPILNIFLFLIKTLIKIIKFILIKLLKLFIKMCLAIWKFITNTK